jgi:hypothetical protein
MSLTSQAAKLTELAEAAGLGAGGEHVPAVTAAEISRLIDEVAEKIHALREAWTRFQMKNGDAASRPEPSPPTKDAKSSR